MRSFSLLALASACLASPTKANGGYPFLREESRRLSAQADQPSRRALDGIYMPIPPFQKIGRRMLAEEDMEDQERRRALDGFYMPVPPFQKIGRRMLAEEDTEDQESRRALDGIYMPIPPFQKIGRRMLAEEDTEDQESRRALDGIYMPIPPFQKIGRRMLAEEDTEDQESRRALDGIYMPIPPFQKIGRRMLAEEDTEDQESRRALDGIYMPIPPFMKIGRRVLVEDTEAESQAVEGIETRTPALVDAMLRNVKRLRVLVEADEELTVDMVLAFMQTPAGLIVNKRMAELSGESVEQHLAKVESEAGLRDMEQALRHPMVRKAGLDVIFASEEDLVQKADTLAAAIHEFRAEYQSKQ